MIPILYIVSPPYSGSTLLTMLLATHPGIGTIGERGHFYRKMVARPLIGSPACSCGQHFDACEFWQAVKGQVQQQIDPTIYQLPFSGFRLTHGPGWVNRIIEKICFQAALDGRLPPFPIRKRYQAVQQANAVLIQAVLAQSGTTLFLDASKAVKHAVQLNAIPGFKVYVLHLVRDGRGQVASILKHRPEWNVNLAAREWVRQVQQQESILERAGMPVQRLRYEDLCADPAAIIADALTFAGLDPALATLAFRERPLHIMGNLMRLEDTAEIQDRQEWRTRLDEAQLAAFSSIAGPLNHALGYHQYK